MTIAEALSLLAASEIGDIEREWSKYNVAGNASITFNITKDTKAIVEGIYRATGMKMWTLEYGSGSKMDTSNPLLNKYQHINIYNFYRGRSPHSEEGGTEIRTRSKGGYYDLDRVRHKGSGLGISQKHQYGLNAEWLRGGHAVIPIEPHYIIKNIIPRKNTVHKQQFRKNILAAIRDTLRGAMKK